jgi:hypothetical protein
MPGRMIRQSSAEDPFADRRRSRAVGRETIWVAALGGLFIAALFLIATFWADPWPGMSPTTPTGTMRSSIWRSNSIRPGHGATSARR